MKRAKRKPAITKYGRAHHEQFAIEAVESARRELPSTYNCTPDAAYATVRANRDIARARAHVGSIGPTDSARTGKLWGFVGKAEREVGEASNRIASCLLPRSR